MQVSQWICRLPNLLTQISGNVAASNGPLKICSLAACVDIAMVTILQQWCRLHYTHPTNSTKPHLLLSIHSSFPQKLKTLLFNKSYFDQSSYPYLPPCLNSKHHSLPDSGSEPLPIDFVLDKRLWISWLLPALFPIFSSSFPIVFWGFFVSYKKQ